LVVVAGRESEAEGLRAALTRLVGAVGVLALVSVAVQLLSGGASTGAGEAASADSAEAVRVTAEATATGAASGLPPGLVFFCGGLAVLVVGLVAWYVRARRGEE
jgi:hypothetical protein